MQEHVLHIKLVDRPECETIRKSTERTVAGLITRLKVSS
jgi:hypothetical protein